MCATNLWVVDAELFSPDFQEFTADRLDAPVVETGFRVVSGMVARTAAVFIATRTSCDCASLIGRRGDQEDDQEVSAEAWLGWLGDLPIRFPRLGRIAVLRAWNPQGERISPRKARELPIGMITEAVLRDVRDDTLLAITYPTK